tara:strand:+ start:1283 stop:1402 length:120 start_codon:yes stop_codon:yes gene_type:complete
MEALYIVALIMNLKIIFGLQQCMETYHLAYIGGGTEVFF